MSMYYKLNEDKTVVPASREDAMEIFNTHEQRRVAATEHGAVKVSTVFLVFNHAYDEGPPMVFETMIFGGEHDQYQDRCSTYARALDMHKTACKVAWPDGKPSCE